MIAVIKNTCETTAILKLAKTFYTRMKFTGEN